MCTYYISTLDYTHVLTTCTNLLGRIHFFIDQWQFDVIIFKYIQNMIKRKFQNIAIKTIFMVMKLEKTLLVKHVFPFLLLSHDCTYHNTITIKQLWMKWQNWQSGNLMDGNIRGSDGPIPILARSLSVESTVKRASEHRQ